MSSLFRCVAGIIAKSIAAVMKQRGGETEELMRWVWRGRYGLNSTRKYRTIAKPYFDRAYPEQIERPVACKRANKREHLVTPV